MPKMFDRTHKKTSLEKVLQCSFVSSNWPQKIQARVFYRVLCTSSSTLNEVGYSFPFLFMEPSHRSLTVWWWCRVGDDIEKQWWHVVNMGPRPPTRQCVCLSIYLVVGVGVCICVYVWYVYICMYVYTDWKNGGKKFDEESREWLNSRYYTSHKKTRTRTTKWQMYNFVMEGSVFYTLMIDD
jgi:hypothetical protein